MVHKIALISVSVSPQPHMARRSDTSRSFKSTDMGPVMYCMSHGVLVLTPSLRRYKFYCLVNRGTCVWTIELAHGRYVELSGQNLKSNALITMPTRHNNNLSIPGLLLYYYTILINLFLLLMYDVVERHGTGDQEVAGSIRIPANLTLRNILG